MIALLASGLTILLVAQIAEWATGWAGRTLSDRVESTVLALLEQRGQGERRALFVVDEAGRPDEAMLDGFVAAATERYGRAKRASVVSLAPRAEHMEVVAAVALRFERDDVLATVRLRMVPASANELALLGVELLDRTLGDLAVGDLDGERRPQPSADGGAAPRTGARGPSGGEGRGPGESTGADESGSAG